MAKKKWIGEQIAILDNILRFLRLNEGTGSIQQEPYKKDFFQKIFREAYRDGYCRPKLKYDERKDRMVRCKSQRPLVHRDAIWQHACKAEWVHPEMTDDDKRFRDIQLVMTWWEEWAYAWDFTVPKRKYNRNP